MRADARRNREALIEAAREAFREQGYDSALDDIAKRAGVGPGTLYRHFPTRDDLIDAVLQAWVGDVLVATDKALAVESSPRDLLLGWFRSYVDLLNARSGMAAKITNALGDDASPIATKCQTLCDANARILDRMRELDVLRGGVDALQVSRLLGGVATIADNRSLPDEQVEPLLEVVANGILTDS